MICISDNKKNWKSVKPLFSDKNIMNDIYTIVENNLIINKLEINLNKIEIANKFNRMFSSAVDDCR